MKSIKTALCLFSAALTALWFLADNLWPQPFNYMAFRKVFMQYSGIISMGVMSACMILATRPKFLEAPLGGLDKMYRLHKWLGITALCASISHWWFGQGTKWMAQWGWIEARRPGGGRPGGGQAAADGVMTLQQWLGSQRHLAENVGEWAFYAAALLMIMALVKRIPYHWFVKFHKLLAVGYLALVFHALVLLKYDYWAQPIGWMMAFLLAAGTVSALMVLFKHVGAGRKVQGKVESLHHSPILNVLTTTVKLQAGWPGHQAGQFAFVRDNSSRESAHPYTIASAWQEGKDSIAFVIKALGDYTGKLHESLQAGDSVTLEGPYGCFTFHDAQPRQIWVGGGIGITPFIARMQQLAAEHGGNPPQPVDLFHSTSDYDEHAIALLSADAAAAGIRLHVVWSTRDGYLTGEQIRTAVPEWQQAGIWFCGPNGFARDLRRDFAAQGFDMKHFHQELFEMR